MGVIYTAILWEQYMRVYSCNGERDWHAYNKEGRMPIIPKIKKMLYATDLSKNFADSFRYAMN